MQKLIKIIALVFGTVFLLWFSESTIESVVKSVKHDEIGKINGVINHDVDNKIMIWGASTAYVNFVPKRIDSALNMSCFNMGLNGTNIDQFNGLLKEYLSYSQKCKYLVIIIDIRSGLTKRNKIYDPFNWVHHSDNDNIYNSLKQIDDETMIKARYVPFYPLILYDKNTFRYFRKELLNPSEKYDFPNLGSSFHMDPIFKATKTKPFRSKIDSRVLDKVISSCDLALEKNIIPILVMPSVYKEGLQIVQNIQEIEDTLRNTKNKETYLFNFVNTSISESTEFFQDYTHLNYRGAIKLTDLLIKEIKRIEASINP